MGANNADFHNVSYRYAGKGPQHGFDSNGPWAHVYTAHIGDKTVGKLQLMPSGTVDIVEVDAEHQRKGIATGLYRFAEQMHSQTDGHLPLPQHSSIRSEEGDAWAKKVGGYLPPNEAY